MIDSAPRAIVMTKSCVLAPWCFIHFHPHSVPSASCQEELWLCLALPPAKRFLIYVLINLTERLDRWELGLRASLCSQAGFLAFYFNWSREGEAGAVGGSGSSGGGGSGCDKRRALWRMRQRQKYLLPASPFNGSFLLKSFS